MSITYEVSTYNYSLDDTDADFCSHFKTSLTVFDNMKKVSIILPLKQINFLRILKILISLYGK